MNTALRARPAETLAGFEETIHDLEAWIGCPQCEAERRGAQFADNPHGSYGRGVWRACWDVKRHPHECGKVASD